MAKTTTVTVTDDIDGSAAAEEISFGYRGTSYTIDLSKKNAAAFDKALKPYVTAATKVPNSGRTPATVGRGRRPAATQTRKSVQAIREWAAANGHTINSRGRIPAEIRTAYDSATK